MKIKILHTGNVSEIVDMSPCEWENLLYDIDRKAKMFKNHMQLNLSSPIYVISQYLASIGLEGYEIIEEHNSTIKQEENKMLLSTSESMAELEKDSNAVFVSRTGKNELALNKEGTNEIELTIGNTVVGTHLFAEGKMWEKKVSSVPVKTAIEAFSNGSTIYCHSKDGGTRYYDPEKNISLISNSSHSITPDEILNWKWYIKSSFNKSNLKDGMVVELRNGAGRLVWNHKFIDKHGYLDFCDFENDLMSKNDNSYDIIKVYSVQDAGYFEDFLRVLDKDIIWDRNKNN